MTNSIDTPTRRSFLGLGAATCLTALAGGLGKALAAGTIKPGPNAVLLVIDVQKCFLPGGTLPVTDGDQVVPIINALSKKFANVVLTQDWHTQDNISFATNHEGKAPFETVELDYGIQVLWPDHCVQGTADSDFAPGLDIPHAQLIIRKGYNDFVDSYSAFQAADKKTATGLASYLRERGITEVYACGLATDFCVAWSALDARANGFTVSVIEDACRAIDLNGSLQAAWDAMTDAGIARVQSSEFA